MGNSLFNNTSEQTEASKPTLTEKTKAAGVLLTELAHHAAHHCHELGDEITDCVCEGLFNHDR